MSPLRRVPLMEVASVDYGTRLTRRSDGGTKYPVYGGGGETFRTDSWNREDCYIVSRFAMSEECVRFVGGKFFLNDSGLSVATSDEAVLRQDYLNTYLLARSADIYALGRGTAQRNLDVSAFKAMPISVPSPEEQERIVARFDAVSECRASLRQANATLESEAQVLRTCLVDSLISDVSGDAPLADLCDVFVDGDWVESKDQSPHGIRLVQTGNVGPGFFKANDERARFISDETFAKLRCTEVLPGDCLVSRLPEPVGRACVVPDIGSRMITAVDCTLIRPSSGLLAEYFVYVTQSSQYAAQIRERSTGSTRTRVSRKNLGQVLIPVPSTYEQEAIAHRLKVVNEKVARLVQFSRSRRDLSDRFASGLLSDLIGAAR